VYNEYVTFPVDVFAGGSWRALKTQEDPRLQHLAEGLLDTALRGKAPTTTMK